MLVFKHEAVLGFIDRLVRDPEFAEWFVTNPSEALASYSLEASDLREVEDVVETGRYEQQLAHALAPTVRLIREIAESSASSGTAARYRLLRDELHGTRERVAIARAARSRPWWKFW